MKVDILAFGAHPDDVELGAAGTLLKHIAAGKKAGIVDLTQGDLGTRGSAALRLEEANKAAELMGLSARENLRFRDGFFVNDETHQIEVIKMIRKYRPELVLANAIHDRHPDHGRGSELVYTASFLAGLPKIQTELDGEMQEAWRPKALYHYTQFVHIEPDLVVDISDFIDQKMEAIQAYASQFYDPNSKEPQTAISSKTFIESIVSRAQDLGRMIGVRYAEGFTSDRHIGVRNLFDLI